MTAKDLQRDIVEIDIRVTELFALVTEGLIATTASLLTGDRDEALRVIGRDARIDQLYTEIEDILQRQFALQAPVAQDMRYLLSMLRIVPQLERSGDLVEHIAQRAARNLGRDVTPRIRDIVERMGAVTTELWRAAAAIYQEKDADTAQRLHLRDAELDELHSALLAEIVEAELPLPVAIDMALVARFYERLGDHAVNIANRIRYVALGEGMKPRPLVDPPS